MDTRRAIWVALVVVLVVGAAPALAALADHAVPIQDEVPVTSDQTPTIVLAADSTTDVDMRDMWNTTGELDIDTGSGNMTVTGDSGASARVNVDDIEGTQTQLTEISAGSNWIEIDPADKQRVDVRGDANTLAFSQIAVDDGATDLQIGGPQGGTAEVRLHGLSANTEYGLYDASRDEYLGHITTDSTGAGATQVDLPDGTQALQVRSVSTVAAPAVTDSQPTGNITERPDTLEVNVTAEGWPVDVEFTLEGSTVATKTVSQNGTVTADVSNDVPTLGTYNWSATATDSVNQSDSVATSFTTPDTITLREESPPHDVLDNSTVTIRFFTVDGEIAIQRQTPNGTIDMEGLPDSEFVVFAESPNHYDRRIFVDSIYEQETMFMLNETDFPRGENEAIRSRFVYEDLTGQYPQSETTIQIQRAIDLNDDGEARYRTVAGDYWGASNEFESILEYGERYRLVLVNQQTGQEHVAGTHIPTEDLSQTIRVTGLVQEADNASGVVGLAEFNSTDDGNATIDFVYRDPDTATDAVTITVEGNDTEVYNDTISGPLGTVSDSVALNESQAEHDYVVRFDAGERHQSVVPVGAGTIGMPIPMPGWLLTLLMTMAMTFVGALYGPRTAVLGAWAMVFVAAGVAMFGWAFGWPSVLVAGLVASGMTFIEVVWPS